MLGYALAKFRATEPLTRPELPAHVVALLNRYEQITRGEFWIGAAALTQPARLPGFVKIGEDFEFTEILIRPGDPKIYISYGEGPSHLPPWKPSQPSGMKSSLRLALRHSASNNWHLPVGPRRQAPAEAEDETPDHADTREAINATETGKAQVQRSRTPPSSVRRRQAWRDIMWRLTSKWLAEELPLERRNVSIVLRANRR